MKNIQDIMNEMNTLSDQIAVTLNNEDIVNENLEQEAESTTYPPTPQCASTQTSCGGIDNTVPFCCSVSFPANFEPNDPLSLDRIIRYDLSCLKCIIEECCCNGSVKHDIRIVGCIPLIINVRVRNNNTCEARNGVTFLSCFDSVCVDNIVCNVCTSRDAILACENIKSRLTCANVFPTINSAAVGDCTVQTAGFFTLPTCTDNGPSVNHK
ncbi:hypothetical protein GNF82_14800 [Clostridium perfringens]